MIEVHETEIHFDCTTSWEWNIYFENKIVKMYLYIYFLIIIFYTSRIKEDHVALLK